MPRRYHVILNSRSGTALGLNIAADAVKAYFGDAADRVSVDADMDLPLDERAQRARWINAEVIVAAGGDGTATAVASAIVGTDKTLAVLPLGTVNTLARDLGVPLDLSLWGPAIEAMSPQLVDVGEVDGRIFLHNVAVGLLPALVVGREYVRGLHGLGAKLAFMRFFLRRLFRARRFAVEITDRSGMKLVRRVVALAVGNNEYDEALGRFLTRERLDGGSLGLYLIKHLSFGDLVRLVAEMLIGKWRQDQVLEIEAVNALTVRTRKPRLKVMLDGELAMLDVPLQFRIRPKALSVLAAAPAQSTGAVAAVPAES
ncbi:MAG TPA: diacylglycerol kinase family protein [Devosiaceae bacterium]|jgi:diacylglycerol kinase family enzyme|nr:diacylglycerol kinase family protein [Devosiaceae bacterium]